MVLVLVLTLVLVLALAPVLVLILAVVLAVVLALSPSVTDRCDLGIRVEAFLPDHHEAVGQIEAEEHDAPGGSGYVCPESWMV